MKGLDWPEMKEKKCDGEKVREWDPTNLAELHQFCQMSES